MADRKSTTLDDVLLLMAIAAVVAMLAYCIVLERRLP